SSAPAVLLFSTSVSWWANRRSSIGVVSNIITVYEVIRSGPAVANRAQPERPADQAEASAGVMEARPSPPGPSPGNSYSKSNDAGDELWNSFDPLSSINCSVLRK